MKFALIVELAQLNFINATVVKQPKLGHHWMVAYFSLGSIFSSSLWINISHSRYYKPLLNFLTLEYILIALKYKLLATYLNKI